MKLSFNPSEIKEKKPEKKDGLKEEENNSKHEVKIINRSSPLKHLCLCQIILNKNETHWERTTKWHPFPQNNLLRQILIVKLKKRHYYVKRDKLKVEIMD